MQKPEARAARAVQIEAELLRQAAQLGHFERPVIGARHSRHTQVMLSFRTNGNRRPTVVLEPFIWTATGRHRVAFAAYQRCRAEHVHPDQRVSIREHITFKSLSPPQRSLARERDTCRETIVKIPKSIWWKADRRQKILELLHLRVAQFLVCALKIGEGRIELLQPEAITAPVERLMADNILQRLRHHRPFHRVKMI